MKLRLGRPHGVLAWTLLVLDAVAFLGAGNPHDPRPRLPFHGLFGNLPLGISTGGWLAIALALAATYAVLQLSRGEVTSVDDGPTTTLGLSEK